MGVEPGGGVGIRSSPSAPSVLSAFPSRMRIAVPAEESPAVSGRSYSTGSFAPSKSACAVVPCCHTSAGRPSTSVSAAKVMVSSGESEYRTSPVFVSRIESSAPSTTSTPREVAVTEAFSGTRVFQAAAVA